MCGSNSRDLRTRRRCMQLTLLTRCSGSSEVDPNTQNICLTCCLAYLGSRSSVWCTAGVRYILLFRPPRAGYRETVTYHSRNTAEHTTWIESTRHLVFTRILFIAFFTISVKVQKCTIGLLFRDIRKTGAEKFICGGTEIRHGPVRGTIRFLAIVRQKFKHFTFFVSASTK